MDARIQVIFGRDGCHKALWFGLSFSFPFAWRHAGTPIEY